MAATVTARRLADRARRWVKRLALRGAAVVAHWQLRHETAPSDLSPVPQGCRLQPIPGDRGLPIVGHILAAASLPIEFLESRLKNYGAVSWMRCFTTPFVLALGPEASQEVLANNDHVFSQKGQEFLSGRFFNRGLMFLDFEEHHLHRRIMQEAFTRERLSGYLRAMDSLSSEAAATELQNGELLVYPYFKRALLDIATVVFMGGEPGPQSDLLNKAFTDCLRAASAVVRYPVPGLRWSAGVRSRHALKVYFHTHVGARRTSGGTDLFASLCRARDQDGNEFTDEDVVNQMIFLMSAATETSAAAATATLHQLALHPEWQDRVRAESSAATCDGRVDLEALDRMPSLGMVVDESMRLFPPVPVLLRKTLADTSIQGHYVPKDTIVVVAPLLNHHMPSLWSAPHTFDPERFSDSRHEEGSHRFAYMPFGGGAHKCIGLHFAITVVKVIVHHLLRDYRVEMRPGYRLEWDLTALPSPTDGFPVLVHHVDESPERP